MNDGWDGERWHVTYLFPPPAVNLRNVTALPFPLALSLFFSTHFIRFQEIERRRENGKGMALLFVFPLLFHLEQGRGKTRDGPSLMPSFTSNHMKGMDRERGEGVRHRGRKGECDGGNQRPDSLILPLSLPIPSPFPRSSSMISLTLRSEWHLTHFIHSLYLQS